MMRVERLARPEYARVISPNARKQSANCQALWIRLLLPFHPIAKDAPTPLAPRASAGSAGGRCGGDGASEARKRLAALQTRILPVVAPVVAPRDF